MEKREMKPKRLTLHYLLKNRLPVWVVNATGDKSKGIEASIVSLQIGNGRDHQPIWIQPGPDPICLTDQVDTPSLESCTDLFRLIDKGALKLLDPDNAEEYYEKNEQRKAVVEEKLNRFLNREPLPKTQKDIDDPNKTQKYERKSTAVKLHPKVSTICLEAKHNKNANEKDVLERLMEQSSAFGEEDFAYIQANGVFDSVKSWATEQLIEATKEKE